MSRACRVAALDELWNDEMRGYVVDGARVLLVRLDDRVHAYRDRCAHLGAPMSCGTLERGVLTCGMHHWQYDARTGAGINPAQARLQALPVSLRDGAVWVELQPERSHVA